MRTLLFAALLSLSALSGLAAETLRPDAAYEAAAAGEITIVDIRLPIEWAKTGVPEDALAVSLQDPATFEVRDGFVEDLLQAVGGEKDAPIALICASGSRSSFAKGLLEAEGFTAVSDVSEGMLGGPNGPGWLARDLPTRTCEGC